MEIARVLAKKNKADAKKFILKLKPIIQEVKEAGFTTVRAIAAELNNRKIPTYYPGSQWHRTSVHNVLQRL